MSLPTIDVEKTASSISEQDHSDDDGWLEQPPKAPKLSDDDLIANFFPANLEAQRLFDEKIAEWQVMAEEARKEMKLSLVEINKIADARSRWFCGEVLKISPAAKQLKAARSQIARLRRLKRVANRIFNGDRQDEGICGSDERLDRARQVPILEVISRILEVRKSGKNYVAKCPFHDDKKPSLVIYPGKNRFHCYGCQKHGDAIEFTRLHFGHGFKQAIEYVTRGDNEDERRIA